MKVRFCAYKLAEPLSLSNEYNVIDFHTKKINYLKRGVLR
jgi:hypothetical protein